MPESLTEETIEEFARNAHVLIRALSMVEELSTFRDEVPWVKEWSHQPDLTANLSGIIAALQDLAQTASDRNETIEKDLNLINGDDA